MVLAGLAAFGLLYAAQPVLPEITEELGVGPSAASLTVSASTGALALAVLPGAALAARWGRVRPMRAGLVLAVLLTALAAVAPTSDEPGGPAHALGRWRSPPWSASPWDMSGPRCTPAGLGLGHGPLRRRQLARRRRPAGC